MTGSGTAPPDPFRIAGVIIGIVEDVEGDPLQLGRIRVSFPTLGIKSNWARVASFFAGPDRGGFFAPAKGDEVLVAFEQGDLVRPYVIGALWNGVDKPPVPEASAQTQKTIRTGNGLQLMFDESADATRIEILDGTGNSILIDTSGKRIAITSTGNIELSTQSGDVSISGVNISLSASASVTVKGDTSAELSSSGETAVQGSLVKLN